MFSTRYGVWQINRSSKRTLSDKVLRDKAFKNASDPNYDGYQGGLASKAYKFLIKNLVEVVLLINQIISQVMGFIDHLLKKLRTKN